MAEVPRTRRTVPKDEQLRIFNKTGGNCYLCRESLVYAHRRKGQNGAWHLEHVIPFSRAGEDGYYNLLPACVECNLRKGSKGLVTLQRLGQAEVSTSLLDLSLNTDVLNVVEKAIHERNSAQVCKRTVLRPKSDVDANEEFEPEPAPQGVTVVLTPEILDLPPKYTPLLHLADGGTAAVFLVQSRDGILHAVKAFASPAAASKEITAAQALPKSPFLLTQEPLPPRFILMERCQSDLRTWISNARGPPSERQLVTWLLQLSCALHSLHSAGYAHRDIKPANILLSAQQTLKLADFGGLLKLGSDNYMTGNTITASYAAPEQLAGRFTQAVDLWQVGAVLVELALGCGNATPVFQQDPVLAGRSPPQIAEFASARRSEIIERGFSRDLADLVLQLLCPSDTRITLPALNSRLCSLLRVSRQGSITADIELLAMQQELLSGVASAVPERLSNIAREFRAKPMIVVYGQSGSGKSTFLNALLCEDFFKEGQSGDVGTHCITQLEYGAAGLQATFEWMSAEDWCKERSGLAGKNASVKNVAEVIATKSKGLENAVTFTDVVDLHKHLECLDSNDGSTMPDSAEADLASQPRWMFVKKIRMRAPFPLLKLVTLVDLPGTEDGNQIRSSLAMDFISSLEFSSELQLVQLFIVLKETRAVMDWQKLLNIVPGSAASRERGFPLPPEQLKHLVACRHLSSLSLVVTSCDIGVPTQRSACNEIGAAALAGSNTPDLVCGRYAMYVARLKLLLGAKLAEYLLSIFGDVTVEALRRSLQQVVQQCAEVSVFPGAFQREACNNYKWFPEGDIEASGILEVQRHILLGVLKNQLRTARSLFELCASASSGVPAAELASLRKNCIEATTLLRQDIIHNAQNALWQPLTDVHKQAYWEERASVIGSLTVSTQGNYDWHSRSLKASLDRDGEWWNAPINDIWLRAFSSTLTLACQNFAQQIQDRVARFPDNCLNSELISSLNGDGGSTTAHLKRTITAHANAAITVVDHDVVALLRRAIREELAKRLVYRNAADTYNRTDKGKGNAAAARVAEGLREQGLVSGLQGQQMAERSFEDVISQSIDHLVQRLMDEAFTNTSLPAPQALQIRQCLESLAVPSWCPLSLYREYRSVRADLQWKK